MRINILLISTIIAAILLLQLESNLSLQKINVHKQITKNKELEKEQIIKEVTAKIRDNDLLLYQFKKEIGLTTNPKLNKIVTQNC